MGAMLHGNILDLVTRITSCASAVKKSVFTATSSSEICFIDL